MAKLNLLHEALDEKPQWAFTFYLFGWKLYFDGEYSASKDYLQKASNLRLSHRVLRREHSLATRAESIPSRRVCTSDFTV